MTAIALQFSSERGHPRRGFIRLVLDFIDGFREARVVAHRYRQLSHLSDDQLTTLGLRREDLPRIAFAGRGVTAAR